VCFSRYPTFTASLEAVKPAYQAPAHGTGGKYAVHDAARGATVVVAVNVAEAGAVTTAW
jgi:hypothetical protein